MHGSDSKYNLFRVQSPYGPLSCHHQNHHRKKIARNYIDFLASILDASDLIPRLLWGIDSQLLKWKEPSSLGSLLQGKNLHNYFSHQP